MEYMDIISRPEIHHDRIRSLTSERTNQKIDRHTDRSIRGTIAMGDEAIQTRLNELDKEWDIDRVLMLNFSVIVLAQLVLALKKDKRWLWGPLIQTPFLLMHATLGWCPPTLWFRPLGFRTRHEIQTEREVLNRALAQKSLH